MKIDDRMTTRQDVCSEEVARLEMHILARLSGRVRGLRIVRQGNGFVLQGRTTTYYAKQLVLHEAMQATARPILGNDIEVGHVQQERHTGCSGDEHEPRGDSSHVHADNEGRR